MKPLLALVLSLAVAVSAAAAESNTYNRITFRRGTEAQTRRGHVFPTLSQHGSSIPAGSTSATASQRAACRSRWAQTSMPLSPTPFKQLAGSNWTIVIVNNLSNSVDARIINETNTLRLWAASLFAPTADLDALGTNAFKQLAGSNWTITIVNNLSNLVDGRIVNENEHIARLGLVAICAGRQHSTRTSDKRRKRNTALPVIGSERKQRRVLHHRRAADELWIVAQWQGIVRPRWRCRNADGKPQQLRLHRQ